MTGVIENQALGNRANQHLVQNAMRLVLRTSDEDGSIALGVERSYPLPAAITDKNSVLKGLKSPLTLDHGMTVGTEPIIDIEVSTH
jgi:hypothetical protein